MPSTGNSPLELLRPEIDRFLRLLQDAEGGVARVRARLGEIPDLGAPDPRRAANMPRCGFLDEALRLAGNGPGSGLAAHLRAAGLHWESYDAYAPETIGADFPRRHAYASLIAGSDPEWRRDFDIGFLLIAPQTLYRDHHHLASELYVPLTGPSQWRFGTGSSWVEKRAGDVVWNPPNRVHATLVGDVPLLCLYAWTENVHAPAVVDVAADWRGIEAALAR
jgi:hypothetical protein